MDGIIANPSGIYNIQKMAYGRKSRTLKVEDPPKRVKEDSVMNAVDEYLTLKRIPHYRINSGGLKDSHGRLVRLGAKGMAGHGKVQPGKMGTLRMEVRNYYGRN
jgi:hypothetical protein